MEQSDTKKALPADRPVQVTNRVVDADDSRAHQTVVAAIKVAKPGDRILIRPGVYREDLPTIEKAVELVGDGDRSEVILEIKGGLHFNAPKARLARVTIRSENGVAITRGRVEIEECDIAHVGTSTILISGGEAVLRHSSISGNADRVIEINEYGVAILEQNDITNGAGDGVWVAGTLKSSTLLNNRIHDCRGTGVNIFGAGATLEDNEIFRNADNGVEIFSEDTVTLNENRILLRNFIFENGTGVAFSGEARGYLEENEIFGSRYVGVEIREQSNPVLKKNIIRDGKHIGVLINRFGTLEGNEIFGNAGEGIALADGAHPTLRDNYIHNNATEFASMPGFVGVSIEKVGELQVDAGLGSEYDVAWAVDGSIAPNCVISQSPPAGTTFRKSEPPKTRYVVSQGPLLTSPFETINPTFWESRPPAPRLPLWARISPSPAARAARARHAGRIAEALSILARCGQHRQVVTLLRETVPASSVSESLTVVANELLELEGNVARARTTGVPEALTSRLARQAEEASKGLWQRVERIAIALSYRVDSPGLREGLMREEVDLARLHEAIRDARAGLAELTLAGSAASRQFSSVEARFRTLAETARELEQEELG